MHHSERPNQELADEIADQIAELYKKAKLGATGRYPDGKVTEHDEGEIRFAVLERSGKVFFDFGKPVRWIGMTGAQAIDLGRILIKRGRKAAKRKDIQIKPATK